METKLIKINKPKARKLYYCGHDILLVPSKEMPENRDYRTWIGMNCSSFEDPLAFVNSFDRAVDEVTKYNCNALVGNYLHYYVTAQAMANYEMCKDYC